MGLITAGLAFAAFSVAHLQAQAPKPRPDFSGTWIFDANATDSASSPARSGTNIFGASFVAHQDAKSLTFDITIAVGLAPVKAIYGLDGKKTRNVSPPRAPGGAPIVVTATAKWDEDKLIIESRSQQPGGRGRGRGAPAVVDVVSTRTVWLDGTGRRLVIDRDGTPKQVVPSTRSVYVKK